MTTEPLTGFDALTEAVDVATATRPTHGSPRPSEYASLLINELRQRGFRVVSDQSRPAAPELRAALANAYAAYARSSEGAGSVQPPVVQRLIESVFDFLASSSVTPDLRAALRDILALAEGDAPLSEHYRREIERIARAVLASVTPEGRR